MGLARYWRHFLMNPLTARRAFPEATLDAIQREIASHEREHRGEICFVVEAELATAQLWRGTTPRERAREVFAQQAVWNTEENNGVLIYLLLADHDVEIVADRALAARVPREEWERACHEMEAHFRAGRFEQGAIAGVRAVSALVARHFPGDGAPRNEIPDRPLLI